LEAIEGNHQYLSKVSNVKDKSTPMSANIEKLGKYKDLDPHDKELMDYELNLTKKQFGADGKEALLKLGIPIDRNRNLKDLSKLNKIKREDYIDSYLETNDGKKKSKNGVRILNNNISVRKLSSDLIQTIKKICNFVEIVLMPLAETLYNNRFAGIGEGDKISIPKLYDEMDQKLYILTSINTTDNAQLIKLDNDFEKLFDIVLQGIKSYVPARGGSIYGGSIKPMIEHMYYL
jgi:hypothetical protein